MRSGLLRDLHPPQNYTLVQCISQIQRLAVFIIRDSLQTRLRCALVEAWPAASLARVSLQAARLRKDAAAMVSGVSLTASPQDVR